MTDSIMFTIDSWYILVPVFLFFLLAMILSARFKNRRYSFFQNMLLISFVIYLLCVIHLVLFPIDVNLGKYANLTPWYRAANFIPIITLDLKTFILNIIMLIPFGMYLPFINSKFDSVKRTAKFGFLFSLSLEILQVIIRVTLGSSRNPDINDIIANTFGAVLGCLIIKKLLKINILNDVLAKFKL